MDAGDKMLYCDGTRKAEHRPILFRHGRYDEPADCPLCETIEALTAERDGFAASQDQLAEARDRIEVLESNQSSAKPD